MFYAAQSPRGFSNEIIVHGFNTRDERDEWVAEHADDGDMNSAACGAYRVTAKEARSILGYRGDATTQSFNGFVRHEGKIGGGDSAGWEYADAWATAA